MKTQLYYIRRVTPVKYIIIINVIEPMSPKHCDYYNMFRRDGIKSIL